MRRIPLIAAAAALLIVGAVVGPSAQTASDVGQWSAVQATPVEPIHLHVLPTGKVMFWRSTNPYEWDPATAQMTPLSAPGYDAFCSAHTHMERGVTFVAGGHIANNRGLPNASYYHPSRNVWERLPDMASGRWYPTATLLENNEVLVTAGGGAGTPEIPEVWQTGAGTWRALTTAQLSQPYYPRQWLAPNGKVFWAGDTSRYLDPTGTGAWTTVGPLNVTGRHNYGSAVMYDQGKILFAGPDQTVEVIDLNATAPAWRLVQSMMSARKYLDLTALPDGKVIATNGIISGQNGVLQPQIWDPATETWGPALAPAAVVREYHSLAVLLPDARILTGGGGKSSFEVYSPPYLFKGARPAITGAPADVTYGESFFVETPDGGSIAQVTWIGLSSVTHNVNFYQRFQRLAFSQASGGLNVVAPSGPRLAPPGPYLLFLVNGNGVPSVAKVVSIAATLPSPCTASTLHVDAIVVSTVGAGGGSKRGRAEVTIVDNCGKPVSGATVTGTFSGSISESGSAVTNSSGVAVMETSGTASGKVTVTFCVDNVSHASFVYDATKNRETCDKI